MKNLQIRTKWFDEIPLIGIHQQNSILFDGMWLQKEILTIKKLWAKINLEKI